jgi:hypothetical protein
MIKGKIGILAYGSLIDDLGCGIKAVTYPRRLKGVLTPFHVEFAHRSSSRGGAPTLAPVVGGGAHVKADIFVLKKHVSLKEAKHILWLRETRSDNKTYNLSPYDPQRINQCIKEIRHFHEIDTVIYTSFEPDIADLTPRELAELAIKSVCNTKKKKNRDGISYLIKVKRCGIETPKMKDYEEEIKKLTGPTSLDDALKVVKRACP